MAIMSTTNNNVQDVICRQSQLKFVLDYSNHMGLKLSLKDTIAITEVMADYCINGWSADVKKRVDAVDNFLQQQLDKELLVD